MNPVSCIALISHTSSPLGNQGRQSDPETPKPPGYSSKHGLDEDIPVIPRGTFEMIEERSLITGLSRPGSLPIHPEQCVVMESTVCLLLHSGCTNWCQSRAPWAWRPVSALSHPVTVTHSYSPMCRVGTLAHLHFLNSKTLSALHQHQHYLCQRKVV